MRMFRVLCVRAANALYAIFGWSKVSRADADLRAEMEAHLEMHVEDNIRRGMSPDEARREAMLASGGMTVAADLVRERRGVPALENFASDVRHALRALFAKPGLTVTVVFTLALGIGANTAIYSVVHHLLVTPLPYRDVDHVVFVSPPGATGTGTDASGELAATWIARAHMLTDVHTYARASYMLQDDNGGVALSGARLSAGLLEMIGVQPVLGRSIVPADTLPGAPAVALLSETVWRARFGARRDIVGRMLQLDDGRFVVIGVLPASLTLPLISGDQIWTPLSNLQPHTLTDVIARLRPGVSIDAASREVRQLAIGTDAKRYATGAFVQRVAELTTRGLAQRLRAQLLMLAAAVGLMLLIACANVASLLLARARARQSEFAIRRALGAGRGRLVRLVLTESMMLAVAGGALGVLLAWLGLHGIVALRPPSLEELDGVRIEPMMFGVTLALTLLTGLLFGLAPALFASGDHLHDLLKSDARTTTGGAGARRFRAALVVTEVALSALLLIGAGLLARSLAAMARTDIGFDPHGIVTFRLVSRPGAKSSAEIRGRDGFAAVDAVRRVRGVLSAALAVVPPPSPMPLLAPDVQVDGHAVSAALQPHMLGFNEAQPEYFQVLRMPPRAGRVFSPARRDTAEIPNEIVVSESMAKQYWPAGGAIGGRFRTGVDLPWSTVVGVVADSWLPGFRNAGRMDLQIYRPYRYGSVFQSIVVRTNERDGIMVPRVIDAIRRAAPTLKVGSINPVNAEVDRSLASPRFIASLLALFAGVALLLTIIGLYGVIAYAVAQRTRELGLRIALGAQARDVMRLVVGNGILLGTTGIVVGLGAAVVATRWLRSQLYGVHPVDPATFAAVAAGLVITAVVASYLPARRAARVDPVTALRDE